jgi:5S rRNA maturation endonuclease (ribonuclease M5)
MSTIEEIKNSISLEEMFRRDGHKLIKSSGHFVCLCPFHLERTPSCAVFPDHFYCFGCGLHGDLFAYVMLRDGCVFKDALKKLTGPNIESVRIAPRKPVPEPPKASVDFDGTMERWQRNTTDNQVNCLADILGVSPDAFNVLGAAWAPEHSAWAFPMRDEKENIVGIRLRTVSGQKFAVKGSSDGLFIPQFGDPGRVLFITEGPTDCAAMLSLGLYAIGRANALSKRCMDQCRAFVKKNRFQEVILVSDNDVPGKAAAKKLKEQIDVRVRQFLPPCKDIRKFVQLGGTWQLIETMLSNAL